MMLCTTTRPFEVATTLGGVGGGMRIGPRTLLSFLVVIVRAPENRVRATQCFKYSGTAALYSDKLLKPAGHRDSDGGAGAGVGAGVGDDGVGAGAAWALAEVAASARATMARHRSAGGAAAMGFITKAIAS